MCHTGDPLVLIGRIKDLNKMPLLTNDGFDFLAKGLFTYYVEHGTFDHPSLPLHTKMVKMDPNLLVLFLLSSRSRISLVKSP